MEIKISNFKRTIDQLLYFFCNFIILITLGTVKK